MKTALLAAVSLFNYAYNCFFVENGISHTSIIIYFSFIDPISSQCLKIYPDRFIRIGFKTNHWIFDTPNIRIVLTDN